WSLLAGWRGLTVGTRHAWATEQGTSAKKRRLRGLPVRMARAHHRPAIPTALRLRWELGPPYRLGRLRCQAAAGLPWHHAGGRSGHDVSARSAPAPLRSASPTPGDAAWRPGRRARPRWP